jgi:hypothetical protein
VVKLAYLSWCRSIQLLVLPARAATLLNQEFSQRSSGMPVTGDPGRDDGHRVRAGEGGR